MREFYLYIDGVTYDLNGGKYLFVNPTGLGVVFNNNLFDIGDGFAVSTKREQKIGQVVGKLVFFRDGTSIPYDVYHEFSDLLMRTERTVVLGYKPSDTLYKANVKVAYLTKTESFDNQFIEIPVAFDLMSLWYTEETASQVSGEYSITRGGQYPMAVRIDCPHHYGHPHIKIVETASRRTVQELTSDLTSILTGGTFHYSNEPDNSHFTDAPSGSFVVDLSPYITNISTPELIYGRPRYNSTVTVEDSEEGLPLTFSITVFRYWRTV